MSRRKPPQDRKPLSKKIKTLAAVELDPPTRPGTPAFGLPAGQVDAYDDADLAYLLAMRTLIERREVAQLVKNLVDQVSHAASSERGAAGHERAQAAIKRSRALRAKVEAHLPSQALVVVSSPMLTWNEQAAARLHHLRCEFVLGLVWRLPLTVRNTLLDPRTEIVLAVLHLLQIVALRAGQKKSSLKIREFTKEEYNAPTSPPPSPTHSGSDADSEEELCLSGSGSDTEPAAEPEEWEELEILVRIQTVFDYFAGKHKSLEFNGYTQERLEHFRRVFAVDTDFETWKKDAPTSGYAAAIPFFGVMLQNQTYFNLVAKLTREDFDYLRANQGNFAELIAGWENGFTPSSVP